MYYQVVEINDKRYRVDLEPDEYFGPPWENEDGHGPVSQWTARKKCPGEYVLFSDRGSRLYYDFQAAVKKARDEGWNAPPYSDTETAGERAHKAATADYERMRRWCENDWSYISVVVTEEREDSDGYRYDGPSAILGGVESDCTDYIDADLVPELIAEIG